MNIIIIIIICLIFICCWHQNIEKFEKVTDDFSDIPVPKIIHMTCKDKNNMKDLYKKTLESWQHHHPEWDIRVYDDSDMFNFIKDNYSSDIVDKVNSFKKLIFKIDIFKLLVLYKYGGIYTDMDVECIQNFDSLLADIDEPVILGYGPAGNNNGMYARIKLVECAVMIGKPGHKFWMDFVDSISPYVEGTKENNPVHITGPLAITRFIENYSDKASIKLLDPVYFYPITSTLRRIPKAERNYRKKLLKNKNYDKLTYCVHLFDGSWTH
jgi:mannosyltransferase OCH1-like enzyme